MKIKCDKSSWRQLWSLIKTGIISISFQLLQSQELLFCTNKASSSESFEEVQQRDTFLH